MKLKLKELMMWIILLIILILGFFMFTSCATESLTRPEYHQAQIIKIDTVNSLALREWEVVKIKQRILYFENTQHFEFYRVANDKDTTSYFVGMWSY
jgi:hypothetical protein